MGRGEREGRRRDAGGIVGLAEVLCEHGGALNFDLMTRTHYTLEDVGARLGVRSLLDFVRHLPDTSAMKVAINGGLTEEQAAWVRGDVTTQLMVCLIDELRGMEWLYQSAHSKACVRRPKRFPTPWSTDEELGVRRIGSDPISISQFDDWFDGTREEVDADGD